MIATTLALAAGHLLADKVLQDPASSHLKRHPDPRVARNALVQHGSTHGLVVALATGVPALGLAEAAAHVAIDAGKCRGWYGKWVDQGLHAACKLAWLALLLSAR